MNIIEQIKVNDVSIDGYQGTYYTESPEYVQVTTDSDGKIVEGIRTDGSKHIAGDLTVDGSIYNEAFDLKVNSAIEEIEEIIGSAGDALTYFESIDNPEWLQVTTDSEGKILESRDKDGNVKEFISIEVPKLKVEETNTDIIGVNVHLSLSEDAKEHLIQDLELTNVYKQIFNFSLYNSFNLSNIINLPGNFNDFRIPIQVSRITKGIFGWNINPSLMIKNNNENSVTYIVAPNGSDNNDGLTENTALKTIDSAIEKENVNTIILLSGEYLSGENFTSNLVINKEINLIGIGSVTLFNKNNSFQYINITAPIYASNITFKGGYYALQCTLHEELCVFDHCRFINSTGSNGFMGWGGTYIMNECEASYNKQDGFNYFRNRFEEGHDYVVHSLEIGCFGINNGLEMTDYQYNCSTSHSGCKIIRIYCKYALSRGVCVGDADGCLSLNFGLVSFSTQNLTNDNRRASFGSLGNNSGNKMWLYDCVSCGSKFDILVSDKCYIYTTDRYPREYLGQDAQINIINL